MFQVYCEEQFIGSFETYEEALYKATKDGNTGANFIGCLEIDNKEIYTYVYNTPDGDEQLDFTIILP